MTVHVKMDHARFFWIKNFKVCSVGLLKKLLKIIFLEIDGVEIDAKKDDEHSSLYTARLEKQTKNEYINIKVTISD